MSIDGLKQRYAFYGEVQVEGEVRALESRAGAQNLRRRCTFFAARAHCRRTRSSSRLSDRRSMMSPSRSMEAKSRAPR